MMNNNILQLLNLNDEQVGRVESLRFCLLKAIVKLK